MDEILNLIESVSEGFLSYSYLTFIRPLLEYGDMILDNCIQFEKQELDKIQTEVARIATGTT